MSRRLPTVLIAQHYAAGEHPDPIYTKKTRVRVDGAVPFELILAEDACQNLPQTHPEYRTIRGDGSCGWRGELYIYIQVDMLRDLVVYQVL